MTMMQNDDLKMTSWAGVTGEIQLMEETLKRIAAWIQLIDYSILAHHKEGLPPSESEHIKKIGRCDLEVEGTDP